MNEKTERNKLYKDSGALFMCIKTAKDYGIEKQLIMEIINGIYNESDLPEEHHTERKNQ